MMHAYGCYTRYTLFEIEYPDDREVIGELPGCPVCRVETCRPHYYPVTEPTAVDINGHKGVVTKLSAKTFVAWWLTEKHGDETYFTNCIIKTREDGTAEHVYPNQWLYADPVSIGKIGTRLYMQGVEVFRVVYYSCINGNKVLVE
jgi:hypothetical protein